MKNRLPTYKQVDGAWRGLAKLYEVFKTSDMTYARFERLGRVIEAPLEHDGVCRAYTRAGWRELAGQFLLDAGHEIMHADTALEVAHGLQLPVPMFCFKIIPYMGALGVGDWPAIKITNVHDMTGRDKDTFIRFFDQWVLACESYGPSERDLDFINAARA